MRRRRARGRWRDVWWEALVGLLIVLGILWLTWYAPGPYANQIMTGMRSAWAFSVFLAALAAAVVAQSYWPLRRSLAFWGMTAGFLVVFGASAYAWFSAEGTGLRTGIWIVAIAAAEFVPFAYVVYRKLHVLPRTKN